MNSLKNADLNKDHSETWVSIAVADRKRSKSKQMIDGHPAYLMYVAWWSRSRVLIPVSSIAYRPA